MGRATILDLGRNLPFLFSITLILCGRLTIPSSLVLIGGGSILTALLIAWTERLLDPDRTHFSPREVVINTLLFAIVGVIVVLYIRQGTYLFDLLVGLALGVLTAGAQYATLGHEFFFQRLLNMYSSFIRIKNPKTVKNYLT